MGGRREIALWRRLLSASLVAAGVIVALAFAAYAFNYVWSTFLHWDFPRRLTVLVLIGLLPPASVAIFTYWLFWTFAQRIRDPATALDGDEMPFAAQFLLAIGILVGVGVAAYDCYLASSGLGPTRIFIAFFLTGVVPALIGLLASLPFAVLSSAVKSWLQPDGSAQSLLGTVTVVAGALVSAAALAIVATLGWNTFFDGHGDWPRAFWIVLLAYAGCAAATAAYLPFRALARRLAHRPR